MKKNSALVWQFKSIIRMPMLAFLVALVISAMTMTPALADNHGNHQGKGNSGNKNWNNGNNGKHKAKGHYKQDQRYRYQPPNVYQQPPHTHSNNYPPPPVIYPLNPPSGIKLVFPH
jgi:hypothetical protein